MPYDLVKYKTGWRVRSREDGRYFSKKPMSRARAIKQQRLLYAVEKDPNFLQGKGYCEVKHPKYQCRCEDEKDELDGAGLFNNIVAKAKSFFSDVAKKAFTATAKATAPLVRQDYPPKVRQYLQQNGDGVIQNITIQRTPINSMIDKALNLLSFGKFEEAKRKYAYDKLFHLSMVVIYTKNGEMRRVFIEKNEVINMSEAFKIQKDTQVMPVPFEPGSLTLGAMMSKAASAYGSAFFLYDAFTNNCQVFINNVLDANGLNTPQVRAFIDQDAQTLVKELPGYIAPLAQTLTNVAAVADRVVAGSGEAKTVGNKIVMNKDDFMKEHRHLLKILKPLNAEYSKQKAEMESYMKGGAKTHRERVLKKYGLEDKPHSIAELAKASGVPEDILQQVYNRGVGAYKTQPRSVRLKGSFVKNVDAPMSKKLSKEQWGYARVYSFLNGNPDHDNDLRANKGGGGSDDEATEAEGTLETEPAPAGPRRRSARRRLREWEGRIVGAIQNLANQFNELQAERNAVVQEVMAYYNDALRVIDLLEMTIGVEVNKPQPNQQLILDIRTQINAVSDNYDRIAAEYQQEENTLRGEAQAILDQHNDMVARFNSLREEAAEETESENEGEVEGSGKFSMKLKAPPVLEKNVISKNIGIPLVEDVAALMGMGFSPFLQQLAHLGISARDYLASVRRSAAKYGIDPDAVHLAGDDSKIVVRSPDGKEHEAGKTGYGDYHIYQLLEKKGAAPVGSAEQHRKAYLARATKIKGDWKKDKYSPNSLAVYVLWH
jgi:hypothetical protein